MKEIVKWDYQTALAEIKTLVTSWRNMTSDLLEKLWKARVELTRPGTRTDSTSFQNGTRLTWDAFLEMAGLKRTTVHRWLSQYDPETKTIKELEPPKKPESAKLEKLKPEPVKEIPKTTARVIPFAFDEDDEELSPDLGDGFDDIEQAIDTDPNDALVDLFVYLDQILDEVQTLQGKHQVCNELIKYLRGKSAEYDRKAIGGPF